MDGMGQAPQGGEGGGAQDQIAGLLGAAEFLRDRILESPEVPDEAKQAVEQVTAQYVEVISQVISGGAGQQGGAQPMETVPGGQPMSPAGV